MEEACLMGFSAGLKQGKLGTALLQAHTNFISAFFLPVNLNQSKNVLYSCNLCIVGEA